MNRLSLMVEHVRKSFACEGGVIPVLQDVSLVLSEEEMLGIVGLSGCGKSTLLSIIAGLVMPDAGKVIFSMGRDEVRAPASSEWYRYVQMVVQEPFDMFSPRMTVGEFLYEPMRGRGREQVHRMVESALSSVGLDTALMDAYPHMLSGGQLQRIVIARAFLPSPKLVLYDEPTSALDVITQAQVLTLIREMRRQHPSAGIFVSHDLAVVQSVADRILVMAEGRIVEALSSSDFVHAKHPVSRMLLEAQLT